MSSWSRLPFTIDPVAFEMGIAVRWYSLMYVIAFFVTYILVRWRIKHEKWAVKTALLDDFMFWGMLGVILGGRMGYVVFYDWPTFMAAPWRIIIPFEQTSQGWIFTGFYGMSYHGGVLGLLASFVLFCRKQQLPILTWIDLFTPVIPLGYTFGRIGNFINGELYGRPTSVPWAMIFPTDPLLQMRHPSQLYEAGLEGVFLFVMLWSLRLRWSYAGPVTSLYLIGYGVVRFLIEFSREPDAHLGFVFLNFTMGQMLCAVMILAGLILWWLAYQKRQPVRIVSASINQQ